MSSAAAKPRLTHVARTARDIDETIAFYRTFVELSVVHQREDDGVRVVWLGEQETDPEFVLVFIEVPSVQTPEPTFADHLGYDLPSRSAVDAIAERGRAAGVLAEEPHDAGGVVGYFCMLRDPDGSLVEFSFGQPIKP